MERRDDRPDRMPLPSEDEGDLIDEPSTGETEDPMVASQEGVPWIPPTDRVIAPPRTGEEGAGAAGAPASDDEKLEQVEPADDAEPRDEALLAVALETLRRSDLTAGDPIQVDAARSTILGRGRVASG